MAPDGQVRLQASGIRLDHCLLSRRAKGRLYAPFAHPELFEPIFAAGVTRRRLCDGSGIEQRQPSTPRVLAALRPATRRAHEEIRWGTQDSIDRSNTLSEVVRHDPCFDISRGRPVSLIVREGRGLKGSAREAGVGMETGYRRLRETSTVVVFTPRATAASASPSLSSSSRMRTAPDTTSGAEHPAQPSGPRSGGPGLPPHRFLHPEGDRARHITFHRQSALSRTLVLRRSRAARLGGARFDAQHVDVDQARLVSVEL